ncbi:hypothetical protein [Taibaiella koreensis]|uniref:hypothetical protein n=1 Tax=Taibaiella koreensis TaxID=1268548 RepID=UPI0013C37A4C|nr:hypothetical protein [Taibaiella koreensis]
MNKVLATILYCLCTLSLQAQSDLQAIASEIFAEGNTLYRTDIASWKGTDILMSRYNSLRQRIGGYFSYLKEGGSVCVFYNKEEPSRVLLTISFDATQDVASATVSTDERPFNSLELDLYAMGKKAREEMTRDTIFEFYKGSNPNIIPLIYKGQKKVYIITGPTEGNIVLLGNDYLLTFGRDNELVATKKIHRNLIPIQSKEGDSATISMHSHTGETSKFITPTDICTILEYQKAERWGQHYVISADYVSIWDCKTDKLLILTRKAWERIAKDDSIPTEK